MSQFALQDREDDIQQMLKQLPPSGATLRLLDIGTGELGYTLQLHRPDIDLMVMDPVHFMDTAPDFAFETDRLDAIVSHQTNTDLAFRPDFLARAWHALRSGGRLILFTRLGQEDSLREAASHLQNAGFSRILTEHSTDGLAILSRGEKPYPEAVTPTERLAQNVPYSAAPQVIQAAGLAKLRGRYIYLLVRQRPEGPAWRIQPHEIEWEAITACRDGTEAALIAFSSLPRAVRFMQNAVVANAIQGVNKIPKFRKDVAGEWSLSILLDPNWEDFIAEKRVFERTIKVDPDSAEAPDE
ncbi:MAG: hypothetical protein GYB66_10270 [Chloroflexi bacterium]|nr:hypothetical protein [Chloroflexota bacterium]